jgi:transposase InsO family protein
MAWREVSVPDQRRDFVMLALLEGANISQLCERFGISRETGHLWLRRYRSGEDDFRDRSRRPLSSPRRLDAEIEVAILNVRDEHPAWGARKIAAFLWPTADGPAASSVHSVLRRHGRLTREIQPPHEYGSFERPEPNQLWQMDYKGRVRLDCGTWCHPLTVIDDHSRYAIGLSSCANEQTETVQSRLTTIFRQYGLPEAIYVDNGSPWGGSNQGEWTRLRVWLLRVGVWTIFSTPYQPQGRGKNERFHRSLAAEVFSLARFRGLAHVQRAFDRWRDVYNYQRPHEALGFKVPASRYRPSPRNFPERLPEPNYEAGELLRRVSSTKGYVAFKGKLWSVPKAFRGELLAIRPRSADGQYAICYGAHQIAAINLMENENIPD